MCGITWENAMAKPQDHRSAEAARTRILDHSALPRSVIDHCYAEARLQGFFIWVSLFQHNMQTRRLAQKSNVAFGVRLSSRRIPRDD